MSKIRVLFFVLLCSFSAFASLVVNQPVNGTTVSNPIRIVAADPQAIAFRVYINNVAQYTAQGTRIDKAISTSAGLKNIVVQTWDRNGNVEKYAVSVNAKNSNLSHALYNLEDNFWQSCGTCGNHVGDNRYVLGKQLHAVSSSLKGKYSKFSIGGTNPYTNYYWFLKIPWAQQVSHIKQSFDLYVPGGSDPQAIEFESQHRWKQYLYNFSVSLGYKSRRLKTFDYGSNSWKDTGLAFSPLSTDKWHHLESEWEVDHAKHLRRLVAITIDGHRLAPRAAVYLPALHQGNLPNYMTVAAFQLDMNRYAQDYHVFVDNFTFQYE
jgi:hypothetical protein